jgi:hypothetical protein
MFGGLLFDEGQIPPRACTSEWGNFFEAIGIYYLGLGVDAKLLPAKGRQRLNARVASTPVI